MISKEKLNKKKITSKTKAIEIRFIYYFEKNTLSFLIFNKKINIMLNEVII